MCISNNVLQGRAISPSTEPLPGGLGAAICLAFPLEPAQQGKSLVLDLLAHSQQLSLNRCIALQMLNESMKNVALNLPKELIVIWLSKLRREFSMLSENIRRMNTTELSTEASFFLQTCHMLSIQIMLRSIRLSMHHKSIKVSFLRSMLINAT